MEGNRRASALLAVALATAALAAAGCGGGGSTTVTREVVPGASDAAELLGGIPQDGVTLGDPTAPVTLVEWGDLQCPYCREWATNAFPALVRDYVRPGKLQIVFRGLAFLGSDSTKTLQTALAAGLQDRMWHVVDLLYRNQGVENSGWATDALLADIVGSVDGLDAGRTASAARSSDVLDAISQTAQRADQAKVTGTPTFDLGKTGTKSFHRFEPSALTAAAFRPVIEQLLGNPS